MAISIAANGYRSWVSERAKRDLQRPIGEAPITPSTATAIAEARGTAVSMIVALELMYVALRFGIDAIEGSGGSGSSTASAHHGIRLLPVVPVLGTLALIACLLLIAKLAELRSRRRKPRPIVQSHNLEPSRRPAPLPR